MARNTTARATSLLFVLFFLGFAVTAFAFVDLNWTHWVLVKDRTSKRASVAPQQFQRLRRSILNVRVRCPNGETTGTGFVVKPGFIATAAHVIEGAQACNGTIRLVDYKGVEHSGELKGLSADDDLGLVSIGDVSLPALRLADTSLYESGDNDVRLITIGYPLEQTGASARDNASISGEGSLSRFIRDRNVFVTSGLNLNPGNSGGPIFVRDNWTVLGIARAKLPNTVGEGIGFVASIRSFESFFREKTGQELR